MVPVDARRLMERLFGDAARGEALLLEARAAAPFPGAFLFFAHLAERVYSPKACGGWAEEFKALAKGEASAGHAVTLVHIFRYWKLLLEEAGYRNEEAILRKYLENAVHLPFTRDEASRLITVVGPDPQFTSEVQGFINRILRDDPKDPHFRMFRIVTSPAPVFPQQVASARQETREIIEEATRRGDEATVKLARSFLAELDQHFHGPVEDEGPYDDEEPEDEPFEDDSDISGMPPDMSPKDLAAMASVMDLLANASEADLRRMRKHPPKGVPKQFVDILIDLARSGAPFPPLPNFGPPTKPAAKPPLIPVPAKPLHPPPPPKPKYDPNQPELF